MADFWPLIFTLDAGKRLGRSDYQYKQKYFRKGHNGFGWDLRMECEQEIFDAVSDICIAIESEAVLPPLHVKRVPVEMSKRAVEVYEDAQREYVISLQNTEVEAPNAGVLTGKLLQICGGAVYYDDEKNWEEIHTAKIAALEKILDVHKGEPVLVVYNFGHELERLKRHFPQGEDIRKIAKPVEKWNAGLIPLMFVHPGSAGHGLNMQKGPGRTTVHFGLNWAPDLVQQVNKRVHRPGQKRECYLYYLEAKGFVDTRVLQSLERKGRGQQRLLDAVAMEAVKKFGKK